MGKKVQKIYFEIVAGHLLIEHTDNPAACRRLPVALCRAIQYTSTMEFDFSEEKNQILLRERGVTFQDVISAILDKGVLADFPHPNTERYPNQHILVVEIDGYTCCVPYVTDGGKIFLKTIFPSRKFMYLLEDKK